MASRVGLRDLWRDASQFASINDRRWEDHTLTVQFAAATQPQRGVTRYLAPAALATLLAAVIVVLVTAASGTRRHSSVASSDHAAVHRLPPYWIVRPGETYAQISEKTG